MTSYNIKNLLKRFWKNPLRFWMKDSDSERIWNQEFFSSSITIKIFWCLMLLLLKKLWASNLSISIFIFEIECLKFIGHNSSEFSQNKEISPIKSWTSNSPFEDPFVEIISVGGRDFFCILKWNYWENVYETPSNTSTND